MFLTIFCCQPYDINSILSVRNDEEKTLLDVIFEEEDDNDKPDIDVDNWMKRINEGYTVFFEDIYEDDIAAQKVNAGSVNAE